MTIPTHLLAGLIIGKITGDFTTALAGSVIIDLDHLISYFRHGILFKPKQFLKTIINETDSWGDQRNFLHSIFGWVTVSVLLLIFSLKIGLVFSISYLVHLILDAIDGADFYPFFPLKKSLLKGPIGYCSKREAILSMFLFLILLSLYYFI